MYYLDSPKKVLGSSKRIKQDEKGFVFSLSHFEEKNKNSLLHGPKAEFSPGTSLDNEIRKSMDAD